MYTSLLRRLDPRNAPVEKIYIWPSWRQLYQRGKAAFLPSCSVAEKSLHCLTMEIWIEHYHVHCSSQLGNPPFLPAVLAV